MTGFGRAQFRAGSRLLRRVNAIGFTSLYAGCKPALRPIASPVFNHTLSFLLGVLLQSLRLYVYWPRSRHEHHAVEMLCAGHERIGVREV